LTTSISMLVLVLILLEKPLTYIIGFLLLTKSPLKTKQPTLGCDVPAYPTTIPPTCILQGMLL